MAAEERRERTFWYTIARGFAWFLFRCVCFVRFRETRRINIDAPFIAVGNHKSFMDPLAMAMKCKRYEMRFLGKRELISTPIARTVLGKGLHMIPVSRGAFDMAALRTCLSVIRQGRVLGVFPEGTRRHERFMDPLESGTAVIAYRSRAPVVPVLIHPPLRPFRASTVLFGAPIPLDDLYDRAMDNATIAAILRRITDTFVDMRDNPEHYIESKKQCS